MNTRKMFTMAGLVAGAGLGATAAYVAMRPKLRHKLRKAGLSREAVSLLGHEMKQEAQDAAHDMKAFIADEGHRRFARTRRVLSKNLRFRRHKAEKAQEHAEMALEEAKKAAS
jgi:gas vesicle protein